MESGQELAIVRKIMPKAHINPATETSAVPAVFPQENLLQPAAIPEEHRNVLKRQRPNDTAMPAIPAGEE
jgi:hypothetical protein